MVLIARLQTQNYKEVQPLFALKNDANTTAAMQPIGKMTQPSDKSRIHWFLRNS